MQLGDLVCASDFHCLWDYLNNARALRVFIKLIEDASVRDRCLSDALIADYNNFEAEVWFNALVLNNSLNFAVHVLDFVVKLLHC